MRRRLSARQKSLGPFLAAASSAKAQRARVRLIGHERGLPKQEIDKVLKAKTGEFENAIDQFAVDHDISMDWLIAGNLRGLARRPRPIW